MGFSTFQHCSPCVQGHGCPVECLLSGTDEAMQRWKLPGSFRLKKERGLFMAEKGDGQVKSRARWPWVLCSPIPEPISVLRSLAFL